MYSTEMSLWLAVRVYLMFWGFNAIVHLHIRCRPGVWWFLCLLCCVYLPLHGKAGSSPFSMFVLFHDLLIAIDLSLCASSPASLPFHLRS
jgi:hypothetical protein